MRKATRQPATFGKEKRPQAHLGDGEDFLNGTLRKRSVIFIIGNSWVGRLFGYLFPVCFFGVIYLHPFPLYPLLESGARLIFSPSIIYFCGQGCIFIIGECTKVQNVAVERFIILFFLTSFPLKTLSIPFSLSFTNVSYTEWTYFYGSRLRKENGGDCITGVIRQPRDRDECDLTVNGVLGGHSHQSY